MSEGIITDGLPDGWMIRMEMRPVGPSFDPAYKAYRWGTKTRKRLFRKAQIRTGWHPAPFESRWLDDTRAWIIRTDAELRRESKRRSLEARR